MPNVPTVADLRKSDAITDADLDAAVRAYLDGQIIVAIGTGHRLNAAAAVQAHKPAREVMADEGAAPGHRRTMVLAAIIRAQPEAAG